DVEVGPDGPLLLAQAVGLVRLEAMAGEPILVGVDRDGAQAELGGGAEDPDGDFAPVHGHQLDRFGGWLSLGFGHGGRTIMRPSGSERPIFAECRNTRPERHPVQPGMFPSFLGRNPCPPGKTQAFWLGFHCLSADEAARTGTAPPPRRGTEDRSLL